MVDVIRAAMRSMWEDTCTVYEYQPVQKENKSTIHEEIAVISNEPCKLSFSRLSEVKQTETAAAIVQTVKLFLDENLEIKAGSKIVVTRRDKEFIYGYSGEAGIFDNHQEIVLKPWEGWAMSGKSKD